MMTPRAALALLLLAAACAQPAAEHPQRRVPANIPLPQMKVFPPAPPIPTKRSNAEIARDFLELSFQMESGRELPVMSRFEGPIQLAVTGAMPASTSTDLDRLLARLRSEAAIDIRRTAQPDQAQITVAFLPLRTLQAAVPQAACFVVPQAITWNDYIRSRTIPEWGSLTTRTHATIFIPNDTSPQEIRDCLHEEIAQSLGPLNDLYRLPDSVFNDDNFHAVLTGFDMLILRAYYAPELASGMTRGEAAARLPALLARINPAGGRGGAAPAVATPRPWINAIETALGPGTRNSQRRAAARQAVAIAQAEGWDDNRMAFSQFVLGRFSLASDPRNAWIAFQEAQRIYARSPETAIHAAHVNMHLAAFALSAGEAEEVLRLVAQSLPAATQGENAALLATLLMLRANALEALARMEEAQAAWLDSIAWARYGFGTGDEMRAQLSGLTTLAAHDRK